MQRLQSIQDLKEYVAPEGVPYSLVFSFCLKLSLNVMSKIQTEEALNTFILKHWSGLFAIFILISLILFLGGLRDDVWEFVLKHSEMRGGGIFYQRVPIEISFPPQDMFLRFLQVIQHKS